MSQISIRITGFSRRLLFRFRKNWVRLRRLLARRQPNLHSRITTVFLISFIVFISIAGSSLLLAFNYQLQRYTQFVGHQYAVQLARVLEVYYNTQRSWQGVDTWLQENFTSEDSITDHARVVVQDFEGESSVESGFSVARNIGPDLRPVSRMYIGTRGSDRVFDRRHRPHKHRLGFGMDIWSPMEHSLGDLQNFMFYRDWAQIPMFLTQDAGHFGAGEVDDPNVGLFVNQDGVPYFQVPNPSVPSVQFYFMAEPGAQNLAVSDKLLEREYPDSALLSFCLVDPFCSLSGSPAGLAASVSLLNPMGKAESVSDEDPGPLFDLWFRMFFRRGGLSSTELTDYELNLPDGNSLQDFLRAEGFPGWMYSEYRPDLFTNGKGQINSDNLLERLQPRYTNMPGHNEQMFVLLDLESHVIASNLPEDVLVKELGSRWVRLQKYISGYKPDRVPAKGTVKEVNNTSINRRFRSSIGFFAASPALEDDQNIFVINGSRRQPVGFLYAESIVSPMWKDLNYEVNTVIIKVALLSCLIIALIYWLIDRFHMRKLFMPLRSLSNVAGEVRKGNTKARVEKIPKEAELALVTEQFNKMLDSLAHEVMLREQQYRDMAHELRTPITIISGELQLIQEGVYRADEEKIQGLINQIQQMQGIVQDLEILYKVSQQEKTSEREIVYFEHILASRLLEEAFLAFQTQMKQKGIEFSLQLDSTISKEKMYIHGDARRLHQVFANCLVNAMRYTPEGGQVELAGWYLDRRHPSHCAETEKYGRCLDPDKDYVLFSVADTGCGISEEKREPVFERFFRVDDDRNHKSGGSGLGLAISKSFVELHGGRIWADESHLSTYPFPEYSDIQRVGAKFCFALPCSPETNLPGDEIP
ncbi:HAMP domain-containing sensor histidine kinase [Candidatus Haliotispira prima]|uniref:histidine kinase n=1 Tax=Candidatus Haliotispira prima TaxID=3034016 RepID=A0ABY8MEF9_9SPIO|nr:HAMP domain-containing sensor histidine kinase [Candidatus Haliotispira prima]